MAPNITAMSEPKTKPTTTDDNLKYPGIERFFSENAPAILVWVFVVALIVTSIVVAAYFAWFLGTPLNIEHEKLGQAGDYFGGILNPVLSFLSVFTLLVALVLQGRELRLSREALTLSQEELKSSREAQEDSAKSLAEQNRVIQQQRIEQTFFSWLGTYRDLLGEISCGSSKGRFALDGIWKKSLSSDYIECNTEYGTKNNLSPLLKYEKIKRLNGYPKEKYHKIAKAALLDWNSTYKDCELQLDNFFRVLYRLLKWIDEQPEHRLSWNDKWLYAGIVRSHLSWIEMVFLFYNGMTERGNKFKQLINRYAIFDNLTIDRDTLLVILKDCPMDGEGYEPCAFSSDLARATYANNISEQLKDLDGADQKQEFEP